MIRTVEYECWSLIRTLLYEYSYELFLIDSYGPYEYPQTYEYSYAQRTKSRCQKAYEYSYDSTNIRTVRTK